MRWLGPLTISIAPVPYHPSTGSRSPLSLVSRPPGLPHQTFSSASYSGGGRLSFHCSLPALARRLGPVLQPARCHRAAADASPPSQIVPSSPTKVPDRTINIITALVLLPPHPSPCLVLTAVSCSRASPHSSSSCITTLPRSRLY